MKDLEAEILSEIKKIQHKIERAPVLNGGFKSLVDKVDDIHIRQELIKKDVEYLKGSHEKLSKNVNDISKLFHTPEKGIFPQLQKAKLFHIDCQKSVTKSIDDVDKRLDDHEEKFDKQEEEIINPAIQKIILHQKEIEDFDVWKKSISKMMKTAAAFFGITSIGFIVTIINEVIKSNLF